MSIHLAKAQNTANQDSTIEMSMIFVGDIMGHGPQIQSAEIIKNKSYNYSPCFEYISPILQKNDLAIGNLEVTLPGKPPYKGYPRFRSHDDLARDLRLAGFDMLVTSNNHSNDGGRAGVINTIQTLKEWGFYQTGTFKNEVERQMYYPLLVFRNGFKIAFLNYTYGTNGIKTKAPTIVNEIDEAQIQADLEMAKKLQPDFIITLIHWGDEYQLNENKWQQELAKKIFAWGSDLIVGAHPHVVQPIKQMPDGKVIAYSLGNFISNQKQPNTDIGLMFEIALRKNIRTGQTALANHHYIPIWRYRKKESDKTTFMTLPVSTFENGNEHLLDMPEKDKKQMAASAKRIRKHLNKYRGVEKRYTIKDLNLQFKKKAIPAQ